MKSNEPLVSVLIAVYNDKKFFPFSVDSILKQTYRNFEILIVDDCSNNETKFMLESYRDKYPKIIKYIRLKSNTGDGERARNLGIPYAKGKYIAVLDSDDVAYPDRLLTQVNFLEKNNDIFLVGSQADIIDEKGVVIGVRKQPIESNSIKNSMYRKNAIINPSVMFRNRHCNKFYKIKFPIFNDYYTYAYLLSTGIKFYNLPTSFIQYRINTNGATFSRIKQKFSVNMDIKRILTNNLDYKPNFYDKFFVFIQDIIVKIVPEKILFRIYMLFKNK